jgi:16S rRNA (cytidine1402-2'-O)-methyltransferase
VERQKSFINNKPTLYLVATPIGNLEDMTYRAVRILNEVEYIYCEDTRVSGKLLHHYSIKKPLRMYHDFNKVASSEGMLENLRNSQDIALISDAGHPLISDPGYFVIREVIKEGFNVVSIPGASAGLTGLVVSGLVPHPFLFYGFLDSKETKREKELTALKEYSETLIFYESPHRINKTMKSLLKVMGERNVVIARELTKKFEEIIRGTTSSMQDIEDIKGEMVVIIEGKKEEPYVPTKSINEEVDDFIKEGLSSKDAIKKVAKLRNLPKNDVYQAHHQNKEKE